MYNSDYDSESECQAKKRTRWCVSTLGRQRLHRLYTQDGAALGSVRKFVKANSLSVSKVRQHLHSKPFYAKPNLVTRKFKTLKAFARIKHEVCSMALAYVDKLAKINNGVYYLPVRQDLPDATIVTNGTKTKDSKESVRSFLTMITKRSGPKSSWVDKGK